LQFDPPDRFVAGTIGQPGNRTFFLQARRAGQIVSVVLEKVQVAVLAERHGVLLDELEERGIAQPTAPVMADSSPLDEPLNETFRATTLTLGWDGDTEQILVEARAEADDDDGPDTLRVRLTVEVARSFVNRALEVVAAGRMPCPLCGQPLDPQGHICPRRNGHYVN
jgi:uncharacterized repeat protein (TIGR03847 family)